MFDLKTLNSALEELENTRGIPKQKMIEAIESAFAAAYKKEYGKKGQIIRAKFNKDTGDVEFTQVKIVVDESLVYQEGEEREEGDVRARFNPEHHIMISDAKMIKKDAELDEEIEFPLETKEDFGRIAAQTAKQVIMQKLREAEKVSVLEEFGEREGEIVVGEVQRFERGNLYIDLGRAVAVMPYEEQIPGERYRQGERIRALLYFVGDAPKGAFLKLSRSRPEFLVKLFEMETPELAQGVVEVKAVAREAGSRSKIAVYSSDPQIDPVGALVGQRGVRVSTVTSELGGEKIDIIEYSEDPEEFIENALSPAEAVEIELDEDKKRATVTVTSDQQSLAIGRGGQNVRLASKLTDWGIDIKSTEGDVLVKDGEVTEESQDEKEIVNQESVEKNKEEATEESDKETETEGKEVAEDSVSSEKTEKEQMQDKDKEEEKTEKAEEAKEETGTASQQ